MRAFDSRTTSVREKDLLDDLTVARGFSQAGMSMAIRQAIPEFPLKIQIQTATHCNAACTMCPYPAVAGVSGFPHARMSEALYQQILSQISGRGVERLSLFLMNEPLLDKRIPDWISLARKRCPEVTLGLFTNGSPLTADLALRLADAGLDELCVSVHGFDRRVYESVMQGLPFDRVLRQIREVAELQRCGRLGTLHLQIVMGDIPELVDTLSNADPLLRDAVLLKAFSNERVVADAGESTLSPHGRVDRPRALCQRPFLKLYVMANGDCVMCNVDWRRRVVLGRLAESGEPSIATIWRGEAYQRLREQHLSVAFESASLCERCNYANVVDDG